MRGDEHGDASLFELQDEVPDFTRAGRVHARCGLIQNQKAWLVDEGLREADSLEHALGVATHPTVCGVLQSREQE